MRHEQLQRERTPRAGNKTSCRAPQPIAPSQCSRLGARNDAWHRLRCGARRTRSGGQSCAVGGRVPGGARAAATIASAAIARWITCTRPLHSNGPQCNAVPTGPVATCNHAACAMHALQHGALRCSAALQHGALRCNMGRRVATWGNVCSDPIHPVPQGRRGAPRRDMGAEQRARVRHHVVPRPVQQPCWPVQQRDGLVLHQYPHCFSRAGTGPAMATEAARTHRGGSQHTTTALASSRVL